MRKTIAVVALALALAPAARGQEAAKDPGASTQKPAWQYALYLDGYAGGDSPGYLVPTVFADRAPLHLEARYNYEDLRTASLHLGYTFPFGGESAFVKVTPMIGAVFGNTRGIAPGAEVEARWGRLAFWLEAEFLIDTGTGENDYLYTWSELDLYLVPWLWIGGSVQRMKLEATPTEVDVGPMIGVGKQGSPGWSLSFYAYGLARDAPWYLGTLAVQF
jgi:hypothetical protein